MNHNVTIRPVTEADSDNIIKWRNNPEVSKKFIHRAPLTRESQSIYYNTKVKTGEVAQFIISCDNIDVGCVYIRDIDTANRKGEFGIFIGDVNYFGKGIGTAATKLILQHAFTTLNLNKVFLRVFTENVRAIKSYEKSGFIHDGTFREDIIIDNVPYDMDFMSILKSEFDRL